MLLDGPERPGHCRAALQNARTARTPGTARTAHESCSGPSARPTHPDWTPPMNGRRLPAVTAAVHSWVASNPGGWAAPKDPRSEEHTSARQSHSELVCRLLLEKNK